MHQKNHNSSLELDNQSGQACFSTLNDIQTLQADHKEVSVQQENQNEEANLHLLRRNGQTFLFNRRRLTWQGPLSVVLLPQTLTDNTRGKKKPFRTAPYNLQTVRR